MAVRFLALALVAGSVTAAFAATDDELRQQILGRWGETAECSGSALTFNADGTFVMSNAGSEKSGTYTIAGGKLNGETDQGAMPEVAPSFQEDQLLLTGEDSNPDALFKCK